MWGFLWLIGAFMTLLVPLVSEGFLEEGGKVSYGVSHVFWHFHGTIAGDVIASWWVPSSRVGCMGFHMFLVAPWHSWCRYGLGSLWVP